MLSERQQSRDALSAILAGARTLSVSMDPEQRFQQLLDGFIKIVPANAACVLQLNEDVLKPVAMTGLCDSVLDQQFERADHPRLDIILRSTSPVRFRPNAPIADPFEDFLPQSGPGESRIHACVGVPLFESGSPVGTLTFDAVDPEAFMEVEDRLFSIFGAICSAAMTVDGLESSLESAEHKRQSVASEFRKLSDESVGGVMIGSSRAMKAVLDDIRVVAPSTLPVLITGETGVGKELVARRIHGYSDRSEGALVQVNCAALPRSVAESELFGHVKGAFTGATADRPGKFEVADGGTLFLDEIGELALDLQAQLLRVLQSGEIQRVGCDKVVHVDVRVVSATNRDLDAEVAAGRFRADLFHRLAAFPISVPPLRARRDDIPLLVSHFLKRARQRLGLGPLRMSENAHDLLIREDWPGNIRELENVIERGVLRASRADASDEILVVRTEHLDLRRPQVQTKAARVRGLYVGPALDDSNPLGFTERCDACKQERISYALEHNKGNWAGAARDLGMHRSNLHRLAVRLGFKSADSD